LAFMLLCLIAAAAIAGTSALISRNEGKNQAQKGEAGKQLAQEGTEDGIGNTPANTDQVYEANADSQPEEDVHNNDSAQSVAGQVMDSILADKIDALSFGVDSTLVWPVQGEICLEYNMEHTIYHPTLDVYRCNSGVCITQEAGAQVLAGVSGVVVAKTTDNIYGNTVTVALGDGYEATYGQLGEVLVNVGDTVSANTQLGTVGEPTIYYSTEGTHLFFKIEKDDVPVDPLDFLNYTQE